jgi:tripartite-type tricarboxylate transporter receptor subunit TctC
MKSFARMCCGLLFLALAGSVLAQGYPTRPIRLIVPWPPGQSTYKRQLNRGADKL